MHAIDLLGTVFLCNFQPWLVGELVCLFNLDRLHFIGYFLVTTLVWRHTVQVIFIYLMLTDFILDVYMPTDPLHVWIFRYISFTFVYRAPISDGHYFIVKRSSRKVSDCKVAPFIVLCCTKIKMNKFTQIQRMWIQV